jgi:hypothetical protein
MRAQTILFLSVDGVKEKLDCRPYRGGGEGQSQETTRGCKPRRFKPVEYLDHTGYLDTETVEKVAILRARLGLDNSGLIKLAVDDLHRKHLAKRAFGDA